MARRSSQEWQAIIEQQQVSGLSVVEFCQQQQLNSKYFHARQRSLLKRQQRNAGSPFVKVSNPTSSSGVISLQVGDNRLTLPSTIEPQWLANLLKALSA